MISSNANLLLLFAEDDHTLTEFLNSVCKTSGLIDGSFRFFRNGKELIDFLELRSRFEAQASQPIRIISDFQMPYCDGLALLSWVRTHPVYRDVPFTLMSSYISAEVRLMANSLNATEIIEKPIAPSEWMNLVTAWQAAGRTAPEPPQIGL